MTPGGGCEPRASLVAASTPLAGSLDVYRGVLSPLMLPTTPLHTLPVLAPRVGGPLRALAGREGNLLSGAAPRGEAALRSLGFLEFPSAAPYPLVPTEIQRS